MAIALMQIGLDRFINTTRENHKKLYTILDNKYGIKIYDFYRKGPNPKCPFNLSGKVQVYDYMTSKDQITDDIIIKIRSDVYFTDTSIKVICDEIDNVLLKESDIVYLGIDFLLDYNSKHRRENARTVKGHKVTDFVIIARKNKLADTDTVIEILKNSVKDKSGNKTFNLIMNEEAVATKTSTQMYLVRKDYNTYDNWQIYWDWVKEYRKADHAQEWVKNNAEIIRSF